MAIDFNYEQEVRKKHGYKYIVGLDEVGRGPLAEAKRRRARQK